MNSGDADSPDRLERALQASLRPVDPGAQFTVALQARLTTIDLRSVVVATIPSRHHHRLYRLYEVSLALAASIVIALAVGWQLRSLHTERELARADVEQSRIHTQLLVALEITSEGLDRAEQRIEQYQLQERKP
jgi:hypothetical protein